MKAMEPSMDITSYLLGNADINNEVVEVYPSSRFEQNNVAFKIRVAPSAELKKWRKECVRKNQEFDNDLFQMLVVRECTVEPNFKSVEFVEKAGCQSPEQAIEKVLKSGEIDVLFGMITSHSGFDKSLEDMKKEVKNA